MKKLSLLVLFLLAAFVLVGCGVSEKYADKVNKAAEEKEYFTYEEIVDDLGDPTYKVGGDLGVFDENGIYVWVKGCDSLEEVKEKEEAGKELKAITITFFGGKATKAEYSEEE